MSDHPESPFSVTFRMIDGNGCDVQITMREGVAPAVIKQVFEARQSFVTLAQEHGWTFAAAAKPAQAAPTNGAAPAPVVPANAAAGSFGNMPTEYFDADTLAGSINDGKAYYKVKGGRFTQWGVTIWPEVISAAGLVPEPGQVRSLAGYRAFYTHKPDGKPDKVIRLEKVG